MSEQQTTAAHANTGAGLAGSAYPAPPTRLGGLMWSFFAIQFVVNFANGGAATFLLPLRLEDLDPATKVAHYGLAGTAAAICAIIAQPLWGALSDSTRSRFGRRAPWIVGGVLGVSLGILALAFASDFIAILLLAASIQTFYSMIAAPLTAVVPDRTPVERRGVFSALGGAGIYVGGLVGVFAASVFASRVPVGFIVLAAFCFIAATPFAVALRRDSRLLPRPERAGFAASVRSFWVSPRTHPDFAWAFVARLVLMAGFWGIESFLLYLLQDYCHLGQAQAARVFPVMSALLLGGIVIALVPAGWISDRLGRRKIVVIFATLIIAVSVVLPLALPTLTGIGIFLVVVGIGFGAYLAVDQALMTQVLPAETDTGKALGILNIAQAGGQVVAPGVAALVIGIGGYPLLFVFAGAMAILALLAILPIRGVR